ncbi:hypothetical protein Pelo_9334 [Pelomyxa schiedti]|nr:hypothetical protein Pelo_9334 [Pelomyxa schiedti]
MKPGCHFPGLVASDSPPTSSSSSSCSSETSRMAHNRNHTHNYGRRGHCSEDVSGFCDEYSEYAEPETQQPRVMGASHNSNTSPSPTSRLLFPAKTTHNHRLANTKHHHQPPQQQQQQDAEHNTNHAVSSAKTVGNGTIVGGSQGRIVSASSGNSTNNGNSADSGSHGSLWSSPSMLSLLSASPGIGGSGIMGTYSGGNSLLSLLSMAASDMTKDIKTSISSRSSAASPTSFEHADNSTSPVMQQPQQQQQQPQQQQQQGLAIPTRSSSLPDLEHYLRSLRAQQSPDSADSSSQASTSLTRHEVQVHSPPRVTTSRSSAQLQSGGAAKSESPSPPVSPQMDSNVKRGRTFARTKRGWNERFEVEGASEDGPSDGNEISNTQPSHPGLVPPLATSSAVAGAVQTLRNLLAATCSPPNNFLREGLLEWQQQQLLIQQQQALQQQQQQIRQLRWKYEHMQPGETASRLPRGREPHPSDLALPSSLLASVSPPIISALIPPGECKATLSLSAVKIYKYGSYWMQLDIGTEYRKMLNITEMEVKNAGLMAQCRKVGQPQEPAVCPNCCPSKSVISVTGVLPKMLSPDGKTEQYQFTIRSNCSSSRDHLKSTLVMECRLSHKLYIVSPTFVLRARKKPSNSSAKRACTDRNKSQKPLFNPIPDTVSSNQTVTLTPTFTTPNIMSGFPNSPTDTQPQKPATPPSPTSNSSDSAQAARDFSVMGSEIRILAANLQKMEHEKGKSKEPDTSPPSEIRDNQIDSASLQATPTPTKPLDGVSEVVRWLKVALTEKQWSLLFLSISPFIKSIPFVENVKSRYFAPDTPDNHGTVSLTLSVAIPLTSPIITQQRVSSVSEKVFTVLAMYLANTVPQYPNALGVDLLSQGTISVVVGPTDCSTSTSGPPTTNSNTTTTPNDPPTNHNNSPTTNSNIMNNTVGDTIVSPSSHNNPTPPQQQHSTPDATNTQIKPECEEQAKTARLSPTRKTYP